MKTIQKTIRCVAFMIMAAALSGIMVLEFPKPVSAQRTAGPSYSRGGGSSYPSYSHRGGSYYPYYSHGGGRYYPYYSYRGGRYYPYYSYRGGGYYPWWPWFSVIPALPLYYSTIWVGGLPYYYANGIYYAPAAGGYMIVDPPQDALGTVPPSASSEPSGEKLFIYPRKGQSEQQQADDRYQCHRWAVDQTGYDPTLVSGGAPSVQKRADYQRAMGACLDARGYTAR